LRLRGSGIALIIAGAGNRLWATRRAAVYNAAVKAHEARPRGGSARSFRDGRVHRL